MAAIEKRSREDWQELDREHHLHPFTDHKDLHQKAFAYHHACGRRVHLRCGRQQDS